MAKINPITLRLNYNNFWDASWHSKELYNKKIHEDILIKEYFNRFCYNVGLVPTNVHISRFYGKDGGNHLHINVKSFRIFELAQAPNLTLGLTAKNNPKHIANFKRFIKSFNYFENVFKKDIKSVLTTDYDHITFTFKINKHVNWNKSAFLISKFVSNRLKQKNNFKQIINKAINYIVTTHPTFNNVKGIKIEGSGRLNKHQPRALKVSQTWGSIPLNTIDEHIDFASDAVKTGYGIINIKVWIAYNKTKN